MADRGGVVITGASTGIGAACALGLARRGYRVFAGVRKSEDGARLEERAKGDLTAVTLDVADEDSIRAAAATVAAALDGRGLKGLLNNAGISRNGPLEFIPIEALRQQLEVNVVGQVAVTQAFLPLLREGRGRIVTTGSVGGFVSSPLLGPYSMSKFAIEAFADSLRIELRGQGIEVVLLQPAAVASEIWDKGLRDADEFMEDPPEGFEERYGDLFRGVRKYAVESKEKAARPSVVLKAVVHALESRRPKTRYVMGTGALERRVLRRLPDRLRDRLFLRTLKA